LLTPTQLRTVVLPAPETCRYLGVAVWGFFSPGQASKSSESVSVSRIHAKVDAGQQAPAEQGRHESPEQRADRNIAELLQELRIAGLGVQVLFGFLLSLPFTTRFARLDSTQRDFYVSSLLLAALSIALLAAPVAHHRVVFRRHLKEQILKVANVVAVVGLFVVGFAISMAVLLVTSFIAHGAAIPLITGTTFLLFYGLWFGLPIFSRLRAKSAAEH